MSTLFLSLFLIIFVLFIVTLRIFIPKMYTKYQKYDSLAILPITTVAISFLLINAYGLTLSIIIAICLSFIVFFSNLRRFYNLCIQLDKDSYSTGFMVVSIFQSVLILSFFALLLIYFPPVLKTQKAESAIFYGSHKAGFFVKTSLLEKTSAKLDIYFAPEPQVEKTETSQENSISISNENQELQIEEQNENQVEQTNLLAENSTEQTEATEPKNVIYLSDVFVTTQDAQGTLSFLADKGYDVYAFSFFDKLNYFNNYKDSHSFSPFFMRYEYKNQSENLEKNKEMFVHQKTTEFTSALTLMESMGKLPAFIIAEGNCIEAAENIRQKYPQAILGIYKINVDDKIEGYIDGFSNIQQTKPLEAKMLGFPRDKSWDNAKRIAFFADKKFTTYQTYNDLQNSQGENF